MNLDRRWWIAIAVVVVVAVVLVLSRTVFGRSSEECAPVRDLLEFNAEQNAVIQSAEGDAEFAAPSPAEQAAYQQWADGLAQRAQKVSEPDLAVRAIRLADLSTQFVTKLPRLRAASVERAPGAPTPPVVYEMGALNDQIVAELAELSEACPG